MLQFLFFVLSHIPARSIYPIYYNFIYLFPRERLTTPFTSGCNYLFFVCRYRLHSVAWFSYWFNNLCLITQEIPTIAVLHHPFLFGEIPTQFQAASKGISSAVAGETSSTSISFLITDLISLQFTLFAICLLSSSPPLNKILLFYSPLFSFGLFLSHLSFCLQSCLPSYDVSRKYQVV